MFKAGTLATALVAGLIVAGPAPVAHAAEENTCVRTHTGSSEWASCVDVVTRLSALPAVGETATLTVEVMARAARPGMRVQADLPSGMSWVRAPEGGVFRTAKRIGDGVSDGETVGHVANPYEDTAVDVRSPRRGIIIGRTTLPIVNMGDALFNIGWSEEFSDRASPEREVLDDPVNHDEAID